MTDSFIASFIFEFVGATTKWLFNSVLDLFKGKEKKSFSSFYKAKKIDNDSEIFLSGISNIFLGILVIIFFFFIFLFFLSKTM